MAMARRTLYAYVEGSDLNEVADDIESRIVQFVRETQWRHATPRLVNQRRENDPTLGPDDFPDWELGLNVELPDAPNEPHGWFQDVETIASFLAGLHSITGRDFVIGIGDNECGMSEDLFFVDDAAPDLSLLRQIVGVRDDAS
jgi:hypothetical protein